ncbi:hypothetical protein C8R45DRAFT_1093982 [Mycena sanguinolenta]|nr:hypothetical protein C8R45DRAFT_1093982 [Mycena sanguinolenta]
MSNDEPKIGGEFGENVKTLRGPIDVKQLKFGQSNPTYFLTDANKTKFVLRKKPAGELISNTAHQIEREYTMLKALHTHNTNPSTPRAQHIPIPTRLFCARTSPSSGRRSIFSHKDRRECWLSATVALAALGSISPADVGLSKFASSDYFPRQIKSLSRVSSAQAAVVNLDTK